MDTRSIGVNQNVDQWWTDICNGYGMFTTVERFMIAYILDRTDQGNGTNNARLHDLTESRIDL